MSAPSHTDDTFYPIVQHVFADQSPLVSRRLGFAALPLACLVIRVGMQAVGMASRRAESSLSSSSDVDTWMTERVRWVLIVLGMMLSWAWYVCSFLSFLIPPGSCVRLDRAQADSVDLGSLRATVW